MYFPVCYRPVAHYQQLNPSPLRRRLQFTPARSCKKETSFDLQLLFCCKSDTEFSLICCPLFILNYHILEDCLTNQRKRSCKTYCLEVTIYQDSNECSKMNVIPPSRVLFTCYLKKHYFLCL